MEEVDQTETHVGLRRKLDMDVDPENAAENRETNEDEWVLPELTDDNQGQNPTAALEVRRENSMGSSNSTASVRSSETTTDSAKKENNGSDGTNSSQQLSQPSLQGSGSNRSETSWKESSGSSGGSSISGVPVRHHSNEESFREKGESFQMDENTENPYNTGYRNEDEKSDFCSDETEKSSPLSTSLSSSEMSSADENRKWLHREDPEYVGQAKPDQNIPKRVTRSQTRKRSNANEQTEEYGVVKQGRKRKRSTDDEGSDGEIAGRESNAFGAKGTVVSSKRSQVAAENPKYEPEPHPPQNRQEKTPSKTNAPVDPESNLPVSVDSNWGINEDGVTTLVTPEVERLKNRSEHYQLRTKVRRSRLEYQDVLSWNNQAEQDRRQDGEALEDAKGQKKEIDADVERLYDRVTELKELYSEALEQLQTKRQEAMYAGQQVQQGEIAEEHSVTWLEEAQARAETAHAELLAAVDDLKEYARKKVLEKNIQGERESLGQPNEEDSGISTGEDGTDVLSPEQDPEQGPTKHSISREDEEELYMRRTLLRSFLEETSPNSKVNIANADLKIRAKLLLQAGQYRQKVEQSGQYSRESQNMAKDIKRYLAETFLRSNVEAQASTAADSSHSADSTHWDSTGANLSVDSGCGEDLNREHQAEAA